MVPPSSRCCNHGPLDMTYGCGRSHDGIRIMPSDVITRRRYCQASPCAAYSLETAVFIGRGDVRGIRRDTPWQSTALSET
jgi:hypothetical protein